MFTKKRDPSKILVAKFMKGQFDKIVESKSVPVSELLYRSLISELTDQNYLGLDHYESFDVVRGGVRKTENGSYRFFKDTSFSPLFSLGRDLWIIHAFNEDKAHRLALTFSGQCKNMIAIYCNPTYTRHHRCHDKCVRVLSLYEYADSISPSLRLKYDFQIKLLHNYLNSAKLDSAEAIIQRISSMSTTDLEIEDPDIREALAVMRITVTSKYDAFYFFAAMNLLNAWSSRGAKKMVRKLFTNRYYFKDYVGEKIVHILEHRIEEVDICLDGDFAMISVMGFQFSFHYLPMNEKLSFYWSKGGNGYQEWSGIKLQPIAPLVFRLAKVYLKDYYSTLQKSKNGE